MTIEERRAEILRKRLLNQRLANAKFSDYQTPMGGPRRRGRGALLNSTLGALSSVVSNDDNDLDNISFSTTDGMKVNLQNNRAKDSTPTNKLADFSWYRGNYGGGNEDTVEQQTGIHSRAEAMNKHRERLKLEQEDRNRENAIRSDAIGAFIEKNSAAPKSNGSGGFMSNRNPGGNIDQSVLLDNPGDILDETNSQQKDYIYNKYQPWLGGA
ncbi:MAG: hypothetical protein QF535_21405, partial [Anaerolineales bacterium]|nr:hypothetical protein [Anaerolineales bacterium]